MVRLTKLSICHWRLAWTLIISRSTFGRTAQPLEPLDPYLVAITALLNSATSQTWRCKERTTILSYSLVCIDVLFTVALHCKSVPFSDRVKSAVRACSGHVCWARTSEWAHITHVTGKETERAHRWLKMLASVADLDSQCLKKSPLICCVLSIYSIFHRVWASASVLLGPRGQVHVRLIHQNPLRILRAQHVLILMWGGWGVFSIRYVVLADLPLN